MCIKVSVVIPTHNRYNYLEEAIKSVVAQETSFGTEIVIVDDNSEEDISGLSTKYSCRYFRLNKSRGAQYARNLGVANARGRYIAFLDSDDIFMSSSKLQMQADILDGNHDTVIVFSDKVDFSNSFIPDYRRYGITEIPCRVIKQAQSLLLRRDFIGSYSGVMVRKDVFLCVNGCDLALEARQDWDLWLRISGRGRVMHLKAPLVAYRQHDQQISYSPSKKVFGTVSVLNKHSELFSAKPSGELWKHVHCMKIIAVSSLRSYDLENCQYLYLPLIKLYLKRRKAFDTIIKSSAFKKVLKLIFKNSYFFRGVFN